MRRSGRAALALLLCAVLAFGVVSLVHEATRDEVAAARRARELARFDEVLRGQRYDNDLLADTILVRDAELLGSSAPITAYRARLGQQPVAVIPLPSLATVIRARSSCWWRSHRTASCLASA
jgi:electron transport complex protein RnfG